MQSVDHVVAVFAVVSLLTTLAANLLWAVRLDVALAVAHLADYYSLRALEMRMTEVIADGAALRAVNNVVSTGFAIGTEHRTRLVMMTEDLALRTSLWTVDGLVVCTIAPVAVSVLRAKVMSVPETVASEASLRTVGDNVVLCFAIEATSSAGFGYFVSQATALHSHVTRLLTVGANQHVGLVRVFGCTRV